jgi:hypothetical protein
VTWPPPELDAGVDVGVLRPDELLDELLDELELEPEPFVSDVARCVPAAVEPDEEWVAAEDAPGRLTATAPAATRLAAATETVAARSRLRPRSLASIPVAPLPGGMLVCLLMRAVLPRAFGWRSRLPLSQL